MESKKFPKTCQYCGSLKFERDAVGSLEWMNFRCGSSCDQRGEWSQSDECRITELEAIEAAKDREIEQLRAEVERPATVVRRKWLSMMGMSEAEIDDECRRDPPVDLDAELAELLAMGRIRCRTVDHDASGDAAQST